MGAAEAQAGVRMDASPSVNTSRRSSPRNRQVNALVRADIYAEVRGALIRDRRSLSDLVDELLEGWLRGRAAPAPVANEVGRTEMMETKEPVVLSFNIYPKDLSNLRVLAHLFQDITKSQ